MPRGKALLFRVEQLSSSSQIGLREQRPLQKAIVKSLINPAGMADFDINSKNYYVMKNVLNISTVEAYSRGQIREINASEMGL